MMAEEKVALVETTKDTYGLNQSLRTIGFPKSTWYYHQNEKVTYEEKYAALLPDMEEIARKHPEYGWPRMHVELNEAYGHRVNHKVVQRLLRLWDLRLVRSVHRPRPSGIHRVLLVWRPWRDWPIQEWSSAPSPIAGFHDASGDSCHLILLDPDGGREIWAGSALPVPLLALAVGDVDGDGRTEVVTLEGDYAAGRGAPATRVDVWRWNGFGFTLEWRSPPGAFHQFRLTDVDNDGILDVAVR
jgi:hypothetical protein